MEYAIGQNTEDKLFARWIAGAQNFMSFAEFKRQLEPPKFKDEDELVEDIASFMKGGVPNGNGDF